MTERSWETSDILSTLRDMFYNDTPISVELQRNFVFAGGKIVLDYIREHSDRPSIIDSYLTEFKPSWIPGYISGGFDNHEYSLTELYSVFCMARHCVDVQNNNGNQLPYCLDINKARRNRLKELAKPHRNKQVMFIVNKESLSLLPDHFKINNEVTKVGNLPVTFVKTGIYFSRSLYNGIMSKTMHPYHIKKYKIKRPENEIILLFAPKKIE